MQLDHITNKSRRRYDDACGTALALDLIGERWSLLVMRELMFGPKRFSQLRTDLPGISANTLTQRLEGLEAHGILVRRPLPPPASVIVYELTPWGYEAEPIMGVLGGWAVRSPLHDATAAFSAASLLLSLKTMLDHGRADGMTARIGFRLGAETFVGVLAKGIFTAARGDPAGTDVVLDATPAAIAGVVYGGAPLDTIRIDGDRALARRFVTLFPMPEKIVLSPAGG